MALTVHQQPQELTPAYNDQFILALSTQIAQPDFKYIVTVQVNGGVEATLDILQRPDGYVVVNPIEIVKNFITRDWFIPTESNMQCQGYSADVLVKIKEYYTGAIQSTTNVSYTAFDACLDNETFSSYDYTDYITVGSTYKILNSNIDNRITLNTNYWLQFYNTLASDLTYIIYDSSSTILVTSNIALNSGFICVDIGKSILASYPTASSVEISIDDGLGTYYELFYNVSSICSKHKTYPLYFVDRLGVVNYTWFNQLTKQTIEAKRSYVRLGVNKRTGITYGTLPHIRERHTVNIETTKKIALTTGWLSEEQSLGLVELFDSPIVWFVKDAKYYPVSVSDNSYTINEHEFEPLFNYVINLDFDKTETRQRGL